LYLLPQVSGYSIMNVIYDVKDSWIVRGRAVLERLGWLKDANVLDCEGGKAFGRSIEKSVQDLAFHQGVMKLRVRRKDSAVVMSIDHYQELVELKELCDQLLTQGVAATLGQATNDFDRLLNELTSPASRSAADAIFTASADDLRESYSPGQTERGK